MVKIRVEDVSVLYLNFHRLQLWRQGRKSHPSEEKRGLLSLRRQVKTEIRHNLCPVGALETRTTELMNLR